MGKRPYPKPSAIFRQCLAGFVGTLGVLAAYIAIHPNALYRMIQYPEEGDGISVTFTDMNWIFRTHQVAHILSAVPSAYLAKLLGRKLSNLCIGPLCLISWLLSALTRSLLVLYLVKVIQGFALGISLTVTPIYLAEISDPAIRGLVFAFFPLAWCAAEVFPFYVSEYLTYKWYVYAQIPIPLIFTLAFLYFPETPYWLLKKGRLEEAKKALQWFSCEENVDEEFDLMKTNVEEEMASKGCWRTLFNNPYERNAFILLLILCVIKALNGVVPLVNMDFEEATHVLASDTSFFKIMLHIMPAFVGAFSTFMSDQAGRKTLLLLSCFGCFCTHILSTIYYCMLENTIIHSGEHVWLIYLGYRAYRVFTAVGLGSLLVILQAELFGARTREVAGGVAVAFAGVLGFVAIIGPIFIRHIFGVYVNYIIYAVPVLIGGITLAVFMFETNGKFIGRMETSNKSIDLRNGTCSILTIVIVSLAVIVISFLIQVFVT